MAGRGERNVHRRGMPDVDADADADSAVRDVRRATCDVPRAPGTGHRAQGRAPAARVPRWPEE
jgi:hypothetical protein